MSAPSLKPTTSGTASRAPPNSAQALIRSAFSHEVSSDPTHPLMRPLSPCSTNLRFDGQNIAVSPASKRRPCLPARRAASRIWTSFSNSRVIEISCCSSCRIEFGQSPLLTLSSIRSNGEDRRSGDRSTPRRPGADNSLTRPDQSQLMQWHAESSVQYESSDAVSRISTTSPSRNVHATSPAKTTPSLNFEPLHAGHRIGFTPRVEPGPWTPSGWANCLAAPPCVNIGWLPVSHLQYSTAVRESAPNRPCQSTGRRKHWQRRHSCGDSGPSPESRIAG